MEVLSFFLCFFYFIYLCILFINIWYFHLCDIVGLVIDRQCDNDGSIGVICCGPVPEKKLQQARHLFCLTHCTLIVLVDHVSRWKQIHFFGKQTISSPSRGVGGCINSKLFLFLGNKPIFPSPSMFWMLVNRINVIFFLQDSWINILLVHIVL